MTLSEHARPISIRNDGDIGVVLIHGFTSTTSSMQYLADAFGDAGLNVEGPSLTGHGSTWRECNKALFTDWTRDVETAYEHLKKRCGRIFSVGLSMGGALALHLAQARPELNGVVPINHAIRIDNDWRLKFIPVARFFLPSVEALAGDIKDPSVKEMAYDRTPVRALYQLLQMLKRIQARLSDIRQPALIFKSKDDHVVPVDNATYTYDRIASDRKELVWLQNSYHVATLDYDKAVIVEQTLKFIREVAKGE